MSSAVVFDLDDTLYPEREYVLSGFRAVARRAEELLGIDASGAYESLTDLFESGARGDTFDRWLAANGAAGEGVLEDLVAAYRDHAPEIHPFPEAGPLLEQLAPVHRLGLLSDGYATVQRAKLTALGLAPRFAAIVISDELGRDAWKPDPRPYERVLGELGVAPGRTVYVGDNPAKDFVGARRTGMLSIRVRREGSVYGHLEPETPEHAPDREVTNLEAVPGALGELLGT